MTARNLGTIAQAISRHTRGEIPFGEILQAIADANAEINSKYDWPWTRAEANIQVQPSYNTGTIDIADQTNVATGNGTAWNPAWLYKTLLLGQYTYPIASISDAVTLNLKQTINQGQDYAASPYTIFQDTYPLPDDCEFGSIVLVLNPLYRYRLRYIPVYTMERQQIWLPGFMTNFQTGFCDGGYDDATGKQLIKFTPAPAAAAEYKLIYRRRVPDLTAITDRTLIPESFDRVLELMAEYLVRLNQPTPMPGWMEKKVEAYQELSAMRRKMATAPYDNYSSYSTYPNAEELSFYADGVFIGPQDGSL